MSSVINDYEAIQKFRGDLRGAVDELLEQLRDTNSAIQEVSKDWQDSQFEKFKESFQDDVRLIEPLCEVISDFESGFLLKLETILEEYVKM